MTNEQGKNWKITISEDAHDPTKVFATAVPAIDLKPCPFCGSDNVFFYPDEEQFSDDTTTGFIWCRGCDFASDSYYSEEIAAEKWNKRVGGDAVAAD